MSKPTVDELAMALQEVMPELTEAQARRYALEQADAMGLTGRSTCEEIQLAARSIKDLIGQVWKHFRM